MNQLIWRYKLGSIINIRKKEKPEYLLIKISRMGFDNLKLYTKDLDHYFKLYRIYLNNDELLMYAAELRDWHNSGKNMHEWHYKIIKEARRYLRNKANKETPKVKSYKCTPEDRLKALCIYYDKKYGKEHSIEEIKQIQFKRFKENNTKKELLLKKRLDKEIISNQKAAAKAERKLNRENKKKLKETAKFRYKVVFIDQTKPVMLFKSFPAIAKYLKVSPLTVFNSCKYNRVIKKTECIVSKISVH